MPKEFYTEKDIEDLVHRGIRSLQVHENVVLTELAYEKAQRLGVELITGRADAPPAAPARPHIPEQPTQRPSLAAAPAAPRVESQPKPASREMPVPVPQAEAQDDIEKRIRAAVIARLGNQVDAKLLDNIIHRVVKGVGLK